MQRSRSTAERVRRGPAVVEVPSHGAGPSYVLPNQPPRHTSREELLLTVEKLRRGAVSPRSHSPQWGVEGGKVLLEGSTGSVGVCGPVQELAAARFLKNVTVNQVERAMMDSSLCWLCREVLEEELKSPLTAVKEESAKAG